MYNKWQSKLKLFFFKFTLGKKPFNGVSFMKSLNIVKKNLYDFSEKDQMRNTKYVEEKN